MNGTGKDELSYFVKHNLKESVEGYGDRRLDPLLPTPFLQTVPSMTETVTDIST